MSATPPSIAIAAPVLGGPEVVRVVLNSSSRAAAAPRLTPAERRTLTVFNANGDDGKRTQPIRPYSIFSPNDVSMRA